jgi:hypothetical protein
MPVFPVFENGIPAGPTTLPVNTQDASRKKIFLPEILSQFNEKCAMNGETLVLDTNAIICVLNDGKYSRLLDNGFPGNVRCTSVIVQIELLSFPRYY